MRRILASLTLIALAGGAVLYGAASFVDTETSVDNTITTVSLDLQLGDGNEGFGEDPLGDSVLESWVRLQVKPGDDLACASILARNVGSLDGAHMAITVSNEIDDPPGPESDTADGTTTGLLMAAYVELTSLSWDGAGNLLPVVNPNLDGVPGRSLADIELQGGFSGLPGLLGTPPDGPQALNLCFLFRSDAGNDFQGKTLLTDVIFTLTQ